MVVIAVCNALIVSNHAGYEYYDAPAWCTATKARGQQRMR